MSKYANPPQPPPLFTGTKDSIVSDAQALCDKSRTLLDKLVAEVNPKDTNQATFDKVLVPQIEDENEGSLTGRILGFYQYVSSEAGLRNASTEAEKLMDEFGIEMSMREDVFRLVDAVYQASGLKEAKEKAEDGLIDNKLAQKLGFEDAESARLLDKERKSYIKNGLGLATQEQKDRFKEIKKRLSQIQIQFTKNLNEENGGIWFTPEELDGVPKDVLDGLEKGTGENEGKLRLSFKYPDLFPTLKFAKNPETRKKLFIDNENKVRHSCGAGWTAFCSQTSCLQFNSATRTFLSSKRLSSCVTKRLVCSVTRIMRLSESRTKWPKHQRRCLTSLVIFDPN
jgi:metallopeptidase MepB